MKNLTVTVTCRINGKFSIGLAKHMTGRYRKKLTAFSCRQEPNLNEALYTASLLRAWMRLGKKKIVLYNPHKLGLDASTVAKWEGYFRLAKPYE